MLPRYLYSMQMVTPYQHQSDRQRCFTGSCEVSILVVQYLLTVVAKLVPIILKLCLLIYSYKA